MKTLIAVLGLTLGLAACGTARFDASPTPTPPTGSGDVVLRMATAGGFVPYEYMLRGFPEFSLFGDGRVVTGGAQIEIYPPPALPSMIQRTVTAAGIDRIVAAAQDAGLDGPDARYDTMTVSDAGTTTFTLTVDGQTHTVSVYALGMEADGQGMSSGEKDARAELAALRDKLLDLGSWMPASELGAESSFEADAVRVFVGDYTPDQSAPQNPKDWPLTTSLASFGEQMDEQYRCGAVEGADARTLLDAAAQANQLTPWRSDGKDYGLIFRPLLPDESGCPSP